MTKLISLVEQKNAEGFRSAIETALAEKVADVLDGLKPIVAQNFFASISEDAEGSQTGELSDKEENVSNTCEPGPGKGQAPGKKGGSTAAAVSAKPMPGTSFASDVKLPGQGDHPQKTLASEEVMNELNKNTMGSYLNKAAADLRKKAATSARTFYYNRDKDEQRSHQRVKGIQRAANKLT